MWKNSQITKFTGHDNCLLLYILKSNQDCIGLSVYKSRVHTSSLAVWGSEITAYWILVRCSFFNTDALKREVYFNSIFNINLKINPRSYFTISCGLATKLAMAWKVGEKKITNWQLPILASACMVICTIDAEKGGKVHYWSYSPLISVF